MITCTVRVLGTLCSWESSTDVPLEVSLEDGARVSDIFARLNLPVQEIWRVVINGEFVPPDRPLEGGEIVLIIAPIPGG